MSASAARRYRPETRLLHAGQMRSNFGETSEALYLTQGFVYDSAEQCAARFKGEEPGFLYSRFSNPTVAMFEARMAAFEGAEAARATASGMAAVTAALVAQLKAGDHVVAAKALFGSCRWVVEDLLPRFGVASTLVGFASNVTSTSAATRQPLPIASRMAPTVCGCISDGVPPPMKTGSSGPACGARTPSSSMSRSMNAAC